MSTLQALQFTTGGKTLLFRADGTVAEQTGTTVTPRGRWNTNAPVGKSENKLRYELGGTAQTPLAVQHAFNPNNQLVTTIPATAPGGAASSCTWFGSIEVNDTNDLVYKLMTDDQQDAHQEIVVYGKLHIDDANADLVIDLPEGTQATIKRAKIPNSIASKPRDVASQASPYQLQFSATTLNQFPGFPAPVPAPATIHFSGLWKMDSTKGFIFMANVTGTLAKPAVEIGFAGKFKGVEAGFQYTSANNKLIFTVAGQHTWDHGKGQFKFTLTDMGSALFQADFSGGFDHTFDDGRTFALSGTLTFKKETPAGGTQQKSFDLNIKGTYDFAPDGRLVFSANVSQAGTGVKYDIQLGGTIGFKGGTLTFAANFSNQQAATIQISFDSADLKTKFKIAFGKTLEDTTIDFQIAKSWNIVDGKWVSGDPLALLGG